MLFRKRNAGMRLFSRMRRTFFLPLAAAVMIAASSCAVKGGIVILESPGGAQFTAECKEWSASDTLTLPLRAGDVLQVEIALEGGELALSLNGKNGSEPYTGNDLEPGIFTVAVSETDEYVVKLTGKDATGKVTVKNLGSRQARAAAFR